jgi:micrococcal nuclease
MAEHELLDFTSGDGRLWFYRAKVLRIIDGDTAVLCIDKGMHEFAIEKVRLAGIDAPEMRPRVGTTEQRDAEKVLAAKATDRLRELIDGEEIIIRTAKTGKYGRYLGYLYLPDGKNTANQLLLDEGLAVRYGDPRPWRDE